MVDAVFPQFESRAAEQLHSLAAQTLQLLAMLEVVRCSTAQDATYIAELAGAMEVFAIRIGEFELMLPLDPGARSRHGLQAAADKARSLRRSMQHLARTAPGEIAPVHARVAAELQRLVAVAERLHEAVRRHDGPFEGGDVAGGQQALA